MLITSACLLSYSDSKNIENNTVNPILGDQSFETKFGYLPDEQTDNTLRIRTHLEYAENLLRQKDVSHLSIELQTKRKEALDLLHTYWTNGEYPRNYDFADQRKPCFIDKDGTICAVGYLLEQTTSRELAEQIIDQYKYSELLAMNDERIDDWALSNGLTKLECAMIQPAYGREPIITYNYITPEYGISSSLLSGMNLSLNTINALQIGNEQGSIAVPVIGLTSGAGQILLGSIMYKTEEAIFIGTVYTNESQKTLSLINIGLGTTTVILSAWNLLTNHTPKEKSTTWNVHTYRTRSNSTGVAFSLASRF
ncbi:MAG: hypothetical protein GC205_13140 [Bacteroidetes bacterium]|nr:hypothetical protein [Bacteroidota bacterium]